MPTYILTLEVPDQEVERFERATLPDLKRVAHEGGASHLTVEAPPRRSESEKK
jgi:hypothetical protein